MEHDRSIIDEHIVSKYCKVSRDTIQTYIFFCDTISNIALVEKKKKKRSVVPKKTLFFQHFPMMGLFLFHQIFLNFVFSAHVPSGDRRYSVLMWLVLSAAWPSLIGARCCLCSCDWWGFLRIHNVAQVLAERLGSLDSGKVPPLLLLPMYSQLPADLQAKIFESADEGVRKWVSLPRLDGLSPFTRWLWQKRHITYVVSCYLFRLLVPCVCDLRIFNRLRSGFHRIHT